MLTHSCPASTSNVDIEKRDGLEKFSAFCAVVISTHCASYRPTYLCYYVYTKYIFVFRVHVCVHRSCDATRAAKMTTVRARAVTSREARAGTPALKFYVHACIHGGRQSRIYRSGGVR